MNNACCNLAKFQGSPTPLWNLVACIDYIIGRRVRVAFIIQRTREVHTVLKVSEYHTEKNSKKLVWYSLILLPIHSHIIPSIVPIYIKKPIYKMNEYHTNFFEFFSVWYSLISSTVCYSPPILRFSGNTRMHDLTIYPSNYLSVHHHH